MAEQKASVGRVVHYTSYGTPNGEFASQCRAAIVTEVGSGLLPDATDKPRELDSATEVVGVCVLNPSGMFFNRVPYHDGAGAPGDPDCPDRANHGNPFHYCGCGWTRDRHLGGTWHWPERV